MEGVVERMCFYGQRAIGHENARMQFAIMLVLLTVAAVDASADTRFATSKDGTRIAYDLTGSGPTVVLLHGGGQTRRVWHDLGYVARLSREFTVVTIDFRGNGESGKPTSAAAYAIDRLIDDVLTVVDNAALTRFTVWGFSYGANIGRYLAARSDRVRAMIYIGIPFGAAAQGEFRAMILELRAKWTPIVEAAENGRLDVDSLSPSDREAWQRGIVPVAIAWLSALLDYPSVEPADIRCPTLWVVGTANESAVASVNAYRKQLAGSRVVVNLVDGLTHAQELEKIDRVFPRELEFTRLHQ
jgi:pimeloyl-ACP methyl ester carboxylesterase